MTSNTETKKTRKKGSVRNLVLIIIVVAAAIVGVPTWWYYNNHATTDDAQVEGHILPVMPRVGGYVARVYVLNEQAVKEGDTLFTLDQNELVIKERLAEADFMAATAVAGGGAAGAGAHVAEAQKTAAQANLESAKANLDRAKQDVERVRALSAKDIASTSQLEGSEAAYRSAQALFNAASEQARGSGFNTEGANAQVKAANARLEAAQADLDNAKLQLSYTVVTASTSGHVAKKNLEPGQWISAGQPVMSIVDDTAMWVIANLKETQLDNVREGQSVKISIDAYSGRTIPGVVQSIQYATGARFSMLPPDNATGNYTKVVQRVPVHIAILPDSAFTQSLRPGMSVGVSIDTRTK